MTFTRPCLYPRLRRGTVMRREEDGGESAEQIFLTDLQTDTVSIEAFVPLLKDWSQY